MACQLSEIYTPFHQVVANTCRPVSHMVVLSLQFVLVDLAQPTFSAFQQPELVASNES